MLRNLTEGLASVLNRVYAALPLRSGMTKLIDKGVSSVRDAADSVSNMADGVKAGFQQQMAYAERELKSAPSEGSAAATDAASSVGEGAANLLIMLKDSLGTATETIKEGANDALEMAKENPIPVAAAIGTVGIGLFLMGQYFQQKKAVTPAGTASHPHAAAQRRWWPFS